PTVAAFSPADGASVGVDVTLDLDLELGAATNAVDVTYHVRELTTADDFTIVVMPDTQIYTLEGRNLERYFNDQTKWIRAHREDYNIVGVIHNGDIINNEPQLYQWNVADKAMETLETPEPGLADGMPYGVGVGNHDNKVLGGNTVPDTTRFNQFFGVARFAGKSYYGGHHGARNDDSWFTFQAGGLDFVVVNLMYDLDPDPAVIAWARGIFAMHPEAFGILNTHYVLGAGGGFSPQARMIHDGLKGLPNLKLMTGGHISAESRRFDTFEGKTIHSMLADFQGRTDGGQGFMRLWEFSPSTQTVSVRTYSPTLDKWETDADSEFTLEVDFQGAGGPFRDIQITGAPPDALTTTVDGLAPGKTYEWYADVTTCGKRTTTRIARFTTVASAARQVNDQPVSRQRTKRVTSGAVSSQPDDPSLAD
ncbi:MAG: phosphohydrolase, partial [Deltaproteobacteria bacterium]|nr:phosphohydrolase [Deltaproteobacteria bacterium]